MPIFLGGVPNPEGHAVEAEERRAGRAQEMLTSCPARKRPTEKEEGTGRNPPLSSRSAGHD